MRKTRSAENSTELRNLGVLERWFWPMDQYRPAHFGIMLQFKGTVEVMDWREALDRVQQAHPFLQARIGVSQQGCPAFFVDSSRSISLTFRSRRGSDAWREVLAALLREPVDSAIGPLLRAVVLHGEGHSDLLLMFHPSIADHASALSLAEEIVLAISGQQPLQEKTPRIWGHC